MTETVHDITDAPKPGLDTKKIATKFAVAALAAAALVVVLNKFGTDEEEPETSDTTKS